MTTQMCACGLPLHYSDLEIQRQVEELVRTLGECATVRVLPGRSWLVPRHYIALHGLKAIELPVLAPLMGFREVTDEQ